MYSEQIHLTEKHNAPLPRKSTTCEIINNIQKRHSGQLSIKSSSQTKNVARRGHQNQRHLNCSPSKSWASQAHQIFIHLSLFTKSFFSVVCLKQSTRSINNSILTREHDSHAKSYISQHRGNAKLYLTQILFGHYSLLTTKAAKTTKPYIYLIIHKHRVSK